MKKTIILSTIFLIIMVISGCGTDTQKATTKSNKDSYLSDLMIKNAVEEIKESSKIGDKESVLFNKMAQKYKFMELPDIGSGDGFAKAYLFAYSNNSNPFEVSEGQTFNNGEIRGIITKIDGDAFWIADNTRKFSIKNELYGDLNASRNHFFSDRKIGATFKLFIDYNDKVNRIWIEYVQGKNNEVHSIEYFSDGTIKEE